MIETETKVRTHLARPLGLELLLRQLNPMGLAYTLHGPAGLHLCRGGQTCPACRA